MCIFLRSVLLTLANCKHTSLSYRQLHIFSLLLSLRKCDSDTHIHMISLFLTCFDLFFISSTFGAYRTYYNFQHVLNETTTFVKQVKVQRIERIDQHSNIRSSKPCCKCSQPSHCNAVMRYLRLKLRLNSWRHICMHTCIYNTYNNYTGIWLLRHVVWRLMSYSTRNLTRIC